MELRPETISKVIDLKGFYGASPVGSAFNIINQLVFQLLRPPMFGL